jgi:hypothetical protein
MSKERQKLSDRIFEINEQIKALTLERLGLEREALLLCDDEQRYSEKYEMVTVNNNGKKVKQQWLIGRIHWKEDFGDASTGQMIQIERSQVVKVNGNWDF